MGPPATVKPFHVMVKPIGPTCNLACDYCYYLAKEPLLFGEQADAPRRLDESALEQFTRQYIEAHRQAPEISFAWQGGEPTLAGLDFFRRAVELQERYAPSGVAVTNSIQTNGTLLDDAWCEFFADHHFLVGLSLDGPRDLHDAYRKDRAGRPTFERVMTGLKLLSKHNVDFNALVVVNRQNARQPGDVYRFLRDQAKVQFIQFIPCVERGDHATVAPGFWPAGSLPRLGEPAARPGNADSIVTDWSVDPDDFGGFLCGVFDLWRNGDVGRVFVQTFDTMLGQWMGLGSALCVFAETCGAALAMERDGAVYACDHYVYPEYRRGDIRHRPLAEMVQDDQQVRFGQDKSDRLPAYCRQCRFKFACNGECPKNRFLLTPDGEAGLNYLCSGLRRFFEHVDPWMKLMAAEVKAGRPAANVMGPGQPADAGEPTRLVASGARHEPAAEARQSQTIRAAQKAPGPNAPCPCGSGKKFKKCCMSK